MTTTLTGPAVPQIVRDALQLYREVQAGRWSAAVDVCPGRFANPDAARFEFDLLAIERADVGPWTLTTAGDAVTFGGDPAHLRSALDLYTRVLLGQFGELAWSTGNGRLADACSAIRATYQLRGAWPDHPRGSWSVAGSSAPREAQVAYDAWKLLAGGVKDHSLLADTVTLD